MKKSTKIALGATTFAVAAGAAIVTPIVVSAWGDNSGGRPIYTLDQINNDRVLDKDGKNTITFNSISDDPYFGDERYFVGAREDTGVNAGVNNVWENGEIKAEDGKTYLVRIYTHNNNPNGEAEGAVAKDVTNRFDISTAPGKSVEVRGYINSSNATPTQYWDNVIFKSDNTFHLEYVKGSALYENNKVGKGGLKLSDNVTTSGVKIGYSALDGQVPGCFNYDSYTTIKVKVVYDHEYTVEKKVRPAGSTNKADWTDLLTANIGDEVEYKITYTNTSKSTTQEHVTFKDIMPNNVEYVKGSTTLYNGKYTNGTKIAEDNLVSNGIRVGNYTAGSNAIITFRGKVVDKNLSCGKNEITNWAQVGVAKNTKQDAAKLMVTKTCNDTPDNPGKTTTTVTSDNNMPGSMPNTGAGTLVAGSVVGAGALATSAGYYIASRKRLH